MKKTSILDLPGDVFDHMNEYTHAKLRMTCKELNKGINDVEAGGDLSFLEQINCGNYLTALRMVESSEFKVSKKDYKAAFELLNKDHTKIVSRIVSAIVNKELKRFSGPDYMVEYLIRDLIDVQDQYIIENYPYFQRWVGKRRMDTTSPNNIFNNLFNYAIQTSKTVYLRYIYENFNVLVEQYMSEKPLRRSGFIHITGTDKEKDELVSLLIETGWYKFIGWVVIDRHLIRKYKNIFIEAETLIKNLNANILPDIDDDCVIHFRNNKDLEKYLEIINRLLKNKIITRTEFKELHAIIPGEIRLWHRN